MPTPACDPWGSAAKDRNRRPRGATSSPYAADHRRCRLRRRCQPDDLPEPRGAVGGSRRQASAAPAAAFRTAGTPLPGGHDPDDARATLAAAGVAGGSAVTRLLGIYGAGAPGTCHGSMLMRARRGGGCTFRRGGGARLPRGNSPGPWWSIVFRRTMRGLDADQGTPVLRSRRNACRPRMRVGRGAP